eukprot:scaffold1501_cov70-Phaeocystis_antarctica.AAC.3
MSIPVALSAKLTAPSAAAVAAWMAAGQRGAARVRRAWACVHGAIHRSKDAADGGPFLAVGRMQLRDAELGLAPLEHLRHLLRARVVRAHVHDHL